MWSRLVGPSRLRSVALPQRATWVISKKSRRWASWSVLVFAKAPWLSVDSSRYLSQSSSTAACDATKELSFWRAKTS